MTSKLLQFHGTAQNMATSKPSMNLKQASSSFLSLTHSSLSLKSTLQTPKPPTTKEEAILQAKTSLLSTLKKPLNNPRLIGRFKKLKQSRYRVEIPVIDNSPASLCKLALEVFGEMSVKRKGDPIKILLLWPGEDLALAGTDALGSHSCNNVVENMDLSSALQEDGRALMNSSDIAVFLAPEISQLGALRTASDILFPKPVVIFNPQWSLEEEDDLGEMSGFVESFEVVYSFVGLEVKGILSKKKGLIFKCGEKWNVLVEEEGDMRLVSSFETRPSIAQVENVLYNLMAMNSPITKSSKFFKDLISGVTGRK